LAEHGRPLFQDILAAEEADGRRLLVRGDQALSFIPYFARYPYETFVAPRATRPSLAHLTRSELADFTAVLGETLIRLDNLWRIPFPYVLVLHQAPTDGSPYPGFHFHIQIHPPLRKPGLLKYLAGPEIGGGNFLNDTALAREEPLCLVAEGLPGDSVVLPPDARETDCRWRLLVDPIDGTRGLMYQKRSAWILTGVAPNRGTATRLRDIVLAVQTEIPLVKQHLSDQLWALRG